MVEKIEQGAAGLFYVTDTSERAIFIAAATEQEARDLGRQGRLALARGLDIHGHTLLPYHDGKVFTPDPKGMSEPQRLETIQRMTQHLKTYFSH